MNFLEKLDFLMKKYGLNKRTLSINSDIPYTTIDGWYKKGYEGLKLTTLRKIADYFNTTLDYWFLDEITDPNYGKASGFKVEYNEMERVKSYRALDDHGRESVNITLSRETKRVEALAAKDARIAELETAQAPSNEQAATIIELHPYRDSTFCTPYFRGGISAGSGIFVLGNEAVDELEIPDIPIYKDTDYAVDVNGQSMEPDYMDGDIVLVSQGKEMHPGDVGIFIVDGSAYIKEMGHTELISRNKDFPNIPILESNSAVCMGKVIGKLERRAK